MKGRLDLMARVPSNFAKGDRVRWNYWTDERPTGWHYGTVESEPFAFNGAIAVKVLNDGDPDKGIPKHSSFTNVDWLQPAGD